MMALYLPPSLTSHRLHLTPHFIFLYIYLHLMDIWCWTTETIDQRILSAPSNIYFSLYTLFCADVCCLSSFCACASCKSEQCQPWRWGTTPFMTHSRSPPAPAAHRRSMERYQESQGEGGKVEEERTCGRWSVRSRRLKMKKHSSAKEPWFGGNPRTAKRWNLDKWKSEWKVPQWRCSGWPRSPGGSAPPPGDFPGLPCTKEWSHSAKPRKHTCTRLVSTWNSRKINYK